MPCFFLCAKMMRTTLYGGMTVVVLLALGGLFLPVAFGAGPRPTGARAWDNPYQPHTPRAPRAWYPPQAPGTPHAPPAPHVPSAPMAPASSSAQGGIYNGIDPKTGDQIIVVTPMPGSPVAPQAPQYMPIYPQIFPTYPQPVVPPPLPRQQPWQPPFVYRANPSIPPRPFIPGQSRPPGVIPGTPMRPSTPVLPPGVIPGAPMRPSMPVLPPGSPGFIPQPRR